MNNRVWTVHPGLAHSPGWHNGWTDRLCTKINRHGLGVTEKLEPPKQWPLLRHLGAKERARAIYETVDGYRFDGFRVISTGHSNGTVDLLNAVNLGAHFDVLNLVAGACEADFAKNGLGTAMHEGRVGLVNVWCSGKDGALWWANVSRILFGWTGVLGFGTLGRHGPKNHDGFNVRVFNKTDWTHSTYWESEFEPFTDELIQQSIE